jgi:hypothetical protein
MIESAKEFSAANQLDKVISEDAFQRMIYNLCPAPFDFCSTIGKRMVGKKVMDAVVSSYGPKGSGKSEGDLYLAEHLAMWLGRFHNKPPEYFFTIDNVRSVDPEGTLKMFTSKQLIEKPNQILVIDDASISSNARDFYKEGNKRLNAIITVARIYRHCVLLNTVSSNLIDAVLTQFSDYVIEFPQEGADEITETNEIKFFVVEQKAGRIRKNREPYHKFMQFYNKDKKLCQVTKMLIGRPSRDLRNAYGLIRKEKTDALVMEVFDAKSIERTEQQKISKSVKRKKEIIGKYKPIIKKAQEEYAESGKKLSIKELVRRTGLNEGRVNQIIAAIAMETIEGKGEE